VQTNKLGMKLYGTALAAMLFASGSAVAGLIGDSVTGWLGTNQGPVSSQFVSPQTVGGGAEFVGQFTDGFDQDWQITVDVLDMGFTVGIVSLDFPSSANLGNVGGLPVLTIALGDLDLGGSITSVVNSAYVCAPPQAYSCNTPFGSEPRVNALTWTADSIDLSFSVMRSGDAYTFDINSGQVPEPGTLGLIAIGVAGVAAVRRRRC
jgi:hypothetical protein